MIEIYLCLFFDKKKSNCIFDGIEWIWLNRSFPFQTSLTKNTKCSFLYFCFCYPTNQPKNQFNWQNIIRSNFIAEFNIENREWIEPFYEYKWVVWHSNMQWQTNSMQWHTAIISSIYLRFFITVAPFVSHFHLCI